MNDPSLKYRLLKDPFRPDEDRKLVWLVKQFGTRDWRSVSMAMQTRNSRQCRDRYNNYINPNLKFGNWTCDEDALIIELVKSHGPRWSVISRSFGNRSANTLRNRYFRLTNVPVPAVQVINKDKSEAELYQTLEEAFNAVPNDPFRDFCDSSSSNCHETNRYRGWTT